MGFKEGTGPDRRRVRVIDKSFQYGSLVRVLVATTAIAAAAFGVSWILYKMISGGESDRVGGGIPGSMIALIGFLGIAASYLVIRNTHRIAGPVYRLRRSFERVRDGDLDFAVSFRKQDRFHQLAEGFSAMLESIRKREQDHRGRTDRVRADLDEMEMRLESLDGLKEEKESLLRMIRETRKRLDAGPSDTGEPSGDNQR